MQRSWPVRLLFSFLVATSPLLSARLSAQCDPQWQVGDSPPRLSGTVRHMTTWDPDGTGPAPTSLVACGSAGPLGQGSRVMVFDGTRWAQIGELDGQGAGPVVVWNGQLIVYANSQLLAWNGTSWQGFASVSGVAAMVVHNGELYVGGSFTSIGGVSASRIARWNGSAWSPLGTGVSGSVAALASFQGVLYVGGSFGNAGGLAVGNLAIWNGSVWVATAAANGSVTTMAVRLGTAITNTFLFVGGHFTTLGVTANRVARFSPATGAWSALGAGLNSSYCFALHVRATGLNSYELAALDDSGASLGAYRWDGAAAAWVLMGNPQPAGAGLCLGTLGGQWVAGVANSSSTARDTAFRFVNSVWEPIVGSGIDGIVRSVLVDGAESIIGGAFQAIAGVTVNCIARGHANAWQSLGGGVTRGSLPANISALARMPNGDIVAAGLFDAAGGVPANNIARWNGSTWSPLGSGTSEQVFALTVLPNGDLVAGGLFTSAGSGVVNNIARWNGAAWAPMGVGFDGAVSSLLARANGDVVAGGDFGNVGQHVAAWNGTNWAPLGAGSSDVVLALAELPDGRLIAGGNFTGLGIASYVAAWTGGNWVEVAGAGAPLATYPRALRVLPDGDVLLGGIGTGGVGFPRPGLARLHAASWTQLELVGATVYALDVAADGSLRVGGSFDGGIGIAAARFAQRDTPCPATANTFASGCASSGGNNLLVATTLPWVNGTFHATGTGLPATAVVLAVTSFTPVVPPLPLAAVFAEAIPGCNLHVAPDILEALLTTTGTAQSTLALPNVPPIVGLSFYHQMVPFELDALGGIVAITATNALQATVGIL